MTERQSGEDDTFDSIHVLQMDKRRMTPCRAMIYLCMHEIT